MHFLHIADIHLGFQQYNSLERLGDFGIAFEQAIAYGVKRGVDAILIAGDLFHKATVEPFAFIQAAEALALARGANIPVIAVEGNHDQARYRDRISWLEVLAHEGYLALLSPELDDRAMNLASWDGVQGSYINIQNVRIIGVPWLGSAVGFWLPRLVRSIEQLPDDDITTTVLLTHAGIEGQMPHHIPGCLTNEQLYPLRDYIDYMALGHLHKPYQQEGWLYNPGSLETCAIGERDWKRGMYEVTVEPDGMFTAEHIVVSPRPFFRKSFSVNSYSTPADIYHDVRILLRENKARWTKDERKPVIEINLVGLLEFDRADFDLDIIRKALQEEVDPLVARVNGNMLSIEGIDVTAEESLSAKELEHLVLREIALKDKRYAPAPNEWANVMLDIKERVLNGGSPEAIVNALETHLDALDEQED